MEKYIFEDDGITPNSDLPVLIYRNVAKGLHLAEYFEHLLQKNGWTNNWRDTISLQDHYHSTTHEALAIAEGNVRVQIGGKNGKMVELYAGDVVIIPAGVGHYSLDNSHPYLVVGGYPDGASWDMIYNEKDKYIKAKERIQKLKKYEKLPVEIEWSLR